MTRSPLNHLVRDLQQAENELRAAGACCACEQPHHDTLCDTCGRPLCEACAAFPPDGATRCPDCAYQPSEEA